MNSKNYEANGSGTIWIYLSSHNNCVFHILQEVGAVSKVSKYHMYKLSQVQRRSISPSFIYQHVTLLEACNPCIVNPVDWPIIVLWTVEGSTCGLWHWQIKAPKTMSSLQVIDVQLKCSVFD